MLKRDNWTNDEVIDILESRKIAIKMDDAVNWPQERYDRAIGHNRAIDRCIDQFYDFKEYPEESDSAMAYNTEDRQIYVISKPLPQ